MASADDSLRGCELATLLMAVSHTAIRSLEKYVLALFILFYFNVDGFCNFALTIADLQRECARLLTAADDDDELTIKEFHRRFDERLQAGGIAIADSLESAGASDLESQLVVGLRDERAVGISERDGDECQVIAVGNERREVRGKR